jgi:rfaE bifunctional protein nucleotidyltransferase chain/domain/rfaE bifunctional protein kinase chain/domain
MDRGAGRRVSGPLVVVGDSLLDIDLEGRAGRLAPDAPVPVLDELRSWPRPGGAALAAALAAAADGREVTLITAIAADEDGRCLAALVRDAGVQLVALPTTARTTVKKRVRAGGQSLLRLDSGDPSTPSEVPFEALEAFRAAAGVLVSDYGRGLTASPVVRSALGETARRVPVVWDPHPRGGAPVPGVRLVTPNRDEAAHFADGRAGGGPLAVVTAHADDLVHRWAARAVAVTLGAQGALLSQGDPAPSVFPAPRVPATDACGAGDRFASAAAAALADGALTPEAVQAAVLAAAEFVAAGGAAGLRDQAPAPDALDPVERARAGGGTVVATGGCFDLLHAGHVATLEAARALGDCLVVCLNSDASVRRLKGETRPLVTQGDRVRVLEALAAVDQVVVFDEDTPETVLRAVRPDVWVKGGDYAGADLPEAALLREWGGQPVVLPYLAGRSTTRLVATAAGRP